MTQEDHRAELELRILDLSAAWRAETDNDAKAEIKAEMDTLREAVNDINRQAGRDLGATIDAILGRLETVRTRRGLDAVSALGRSLERLREFRQRI